MKRLLLLCLFSFPGFCQQNAVMLPWTPQQFTNTNGALLTSGKVCTYLAGTSTGTATFTDATASVQNAIPPNAILLDSTARPTSSGIWLTPNKAYKIVTMTAGSDGTCNTGVVVRTQDNVSVPMSSTTNNTFTGTNTFTGRLNCTNFDGNYCVDSANNQGWLGANGGAQIGSAISAASAAGGGHVYIMPGNYNVTANINLATKVSVECVGGWNNTTLTWTGGAGPNAIFFGSSLTDVQVKDCHLVGPNATPSGTSDVRGIEIDGTTRHLMQHNKITGMSYGLFEQGFGGAPGTDGIIKDNWIQTATFDCIVTFDNHVQVLNNRCDNVGTSALHHGIYASGGQDILVQGNQVSNVQGFCVNAVTSGAAGQNNEETRIIGNDCISGGQAGSSARGGYSIGFGGSSVFNRKSLVIGNTIEGLLGGAGIQVIDSNYATVSGNVMRNLGGADCIFLDAINGITDFSITNNVCINTTGGNGINSTSVATTNGTVSGNVFDTIQLNGMTLQNAVNVSIFGNTITNYNVANASANGIFVSGPANVVSNNVVKSSVGTGFGVWIDTASTDNVVSANKLYGNGGAITNNGTRTLIFGNKVNNTDAIFQVNAGLEPSTAGTGDLGTTSLPFANLWLGTAATNNFRFQPATTIGARILTVPDPGANDTLAFLAATQTFTNKTLTSPIIGSGAAITSSGSGGIMATTITPDSLAGTYRVTTDQTITAGASLTNIPGLTWTFPANTALNVKFTCDLLYSQATAAASDSFGFQDVTVAPTNIAIYGHVDTTAGATAVYATNNIDAAGVTTAVTLLNFTPSAAAQVFGAHLDGFIEQPSNASTSVFNIMAQFTTNNGTIKRGSSCQVF